MDPDPGTLLPPASRDPFAAPGRSLRGRGHRCGTGSPRSGGGGAGYVPRVPRRGWGEAGAPEPRRSWQSRTPKEEKEASRRWQPPHPLPFVPATFSHQKSGKMREGCLRNVLVPSAAFGGNECRGRAEEGDLVEKECVCRRRRRRSVNGDCVIK